MKCQFCPEELFTDDGFQRCSKCNIRSLFVNDKEVVRVYFMSEDSVFYSVVMQFVESGTSWTSLWYRSKHSSANDAIRIPKSFPDVHPKDINDLALRLHKLRVFS